MKIYIQSNKYQKIAAKISAYSFERFGLKKLISTSYASKSKSIQHPYQPSLFEKNDKKFDPDKSDTHGKIFILERDNTGDGKIDIDDLSWSYLDGDGSYESPEVIKLRNESMCSHQSTFFTI